MQGVWAVTRLQERSVGVMIMAAIALALLGLAWSQAWFEYDYTSGRQTPPGGPYNDGEDGVERASTTMSATQWEGSVAPDEDLFARFAMFNTVALGAAAVLLLGAALGELPRIHDLIQRRVALVMLSVALSALLAVTIVTWRWMPEMMAGALVDSQFAARLDLGHGYTESNLVWGWYALPASIGPIVGAILFKFQAGTPNLQEVKRRLEAERRTA